MKKTIAVVGAGQWGKNLVRNFNDLGALKTICDPSTEILDPLRSLYPEASLVRTMDPILADPTIRGVVISTPAETHFELAQRALRAGKDVFCEKPLALTLEDGKNLVKLAQEEGRILMVGHVLEYHPAVEKLERLVMEGTLGRINYIYSNRLNLGKVRREENILWSFAPHDLSIITRLLGELPKQVTATGGNYLHAHIADVTITSLEFGDGTRGHVFVSWLHPYKEQRLVVVGEKKMAVFDDTAPWHEKLVLFDHGIDWIDRRPITRKANPQPVPVPSAEPLRRECEDFLRSIEERTTPISDGEAGLRVLAILDAAQRSLNSHGQPQAVDGLNGASEGKGPAAAPPSPRKDGAAPPAHLPLQGNPSNRHTAHDDAPGVWHHPSAIMDAGCTIGEGSKIWHFCHISSGAQIGKDCVLGQNVYVANRVTIGNNVKIQNNVSVYDGVTLEDDVFCGPSMVFTNLAIPRSHHPRREKYQETTVRQGATLGANCTVVCGRTVGRYAFVAAGAVVTKDVPTHALVAGCPATIKGWRCVCGEAIPFGQLTEGEETSSPCIECGKTYLRRGLEVRETPPNHH